MPKLSRKDLSLDIPRRIVVVVIETDLTPPYVARMRHGFETGGLFGIRKVSEHKLRRARLGSAYMCFSVSSVYNLASCLCSYTIRGGLIPQVRSVRRSHGWTPTYSIVDVSNCRLGLQLSIGTHP